MKFYRSFVKMLGKSKRNFEKMLEIIFEYIPVLEKNVFENILRKHEKNYKEISKKTWNNFGKKYKVISKKLCVIST